MGSQGSFVSVIFCPTMPPFHTILMVDALDGHVGVEELGSWSMHHWSQPAPSSAPWTVTVFLPQQLFWNQTLYDYMLQISLLCVTHFHAENHVIQFAICKNPLYLSSWIISILILIPPQHWLLHPPSCPSVSLSVSGSDVTPNYSDSSPSNITMSLWCSCRGTGNQEPECDAFHRDFTHNTCLSESSVCLIPQCLWWPNLVTKPWRLKKRRWSFQGGACQWFLRIRLKWSSSKAAINNNL